MTSIRKREGSDTQLTQIENQQLSHESWAARDRLQNHMGQQSLVPQNNERFPVLQADDLHTFWSTLVPALAEWEISHTVAIKLTHLNSESNVISSSFLVFMPRNNPEHHNAKFQGSRISHILNKIQIFYFLNRFLIQLSLIQHGIYQPGL